MTNRERFLRVLNFQAADTQPPLDRLPMVEWAPWWDKTVARWHGEGLPAELTDAFAIREYFGLDAMCQYGIGAAGPGTPAPCGHGMGIFADMDGYEKVRPYLYPDPVRLDPNVLRDWAARQAAGELVVWLTLEGYFWFPRTLLGIEPHLLAFHDQPELMHRINSDLAAYHGRCIEAFCSFLVPDFMTFAEDMSYNHGPMCSQAHFDEFIAPYYRQTLPRLQERGTVVIVDTDGDITRLVPWLTGVGVEGFLPLERMAGVDVNQLRRDHPRLRMIGGFDKTVMHLGEARIRQEFERLMPAMRSGGYIPSVDHQTPPEVSIEDYRLYLRLFAEYAREGRW
jgi:hypothetical protein